MSSYMFISVGMGVVVGGYTSRVWVGVAVWAIVFVIGFVESVESAEMAKQMRLEDAQDD